jgi:hypothetical protein
MKKGTIPKFVFRQRETTMAKKVGRLVSDPKVGAYCRITLDSGEKILINHDKGGSKGGWLTIERLKLLGFSSDRIFACNLDSREGNAALSILTRDAQPQSLDATPLGAFVKLVKECPSVSDVEARCRAVIAMAG